MTIRRWNELSIDEQVSAFMTEDQLEAFMNAPSGIGPLADEWKDKPHRLVYDLVNICRQLLNDKESSQ